MNRCDKIVAHLDSYILRTVMTMKLTKWKMQLILISN